MLSDVTIPFWIPNQSWMRDFVASLSFQLGIFVLVILIGCLWAGKTRDHVRPLLFTRTGVQMDSMPVVLGIPVSTRILAGLVLVERTHSWCWASLDPVILKVDRDWSLWNLCWDTQALCRYQFMFPDAELPLLSFCLSLCVYPSIWHLFVYHLSTSLSLL